MLSNFHGVTRQALNCISLIYFFSNVLIFFFVNLSFFGKQFNTHKYFFIYYHATVYNNTFETKTNMAFFIHEKASRWYKKN